VTPSASRRVTRAEGRSCPCGHADSPDLRRASRAMWSALPLCFERCRRTVFTAHCGLREQRASAQVRPRIRDMTHAIDRVEIAVAEVKAESPLFPQVIALGNANSRTLGFLPKGAFLDAAVEGRVLAVVDPNQQVVGYVLSRTSDQRAMVVHLCVDPAHRGRRIAKLLVNELVQRSRHLDGLGLWCRSDYAENALWPKLGFQFVRERRGRSIQGS
jgi:ribosomal protein S18 acetylase RimI-like enzyme